MMSDEKLHGEMQSALTGLEGPTAAAAAAAVAKKHGYDCTPGEVEEGYNISRKLEQGGGDKGDLSDKELEAVAGGGFSFVGGITGIANGMRVGTTGLTGGPISIPGTGNLAGFIGGVTGATGGGSLQEAASGK